MSGRQPSLRALFTGTQMTLVAIVLVLLGEASTFLFGAGILLAVAGTFIVGVEVFR